MSGALRQVQLHGRFRGTLSSLRLIGLQKLISWAFIGPCFRGPVWHWHLDPVNRPRLVSGVTDGAREATTTWSVLSLSVRIRGKRHSVILTNTKEDSQIALLELNPITGFKHQLRLTCADELESKHSLACVNLFLYSTSLMLG